MEIQKIHCLETVRCAGCGFSAWLDRHPQLIQPPLHLCPRWASSYFPSLFCWLLGPALQQRGWARGADSGLFHRDYPHGVAHPLGGPPPHPSSLTEAVILGQETNRTLITECLEDPHGKHQTPATAGAFLFPNVLRINDSNQQDERRDELRCHHFHRDRHNSDSEIARTRAGWYTSDPSRKQSYANFRLGPLSLFHQPLLLMETHPSPSSPVWG